MRVSGGAAGAGRYDMGTLVAMGNSFRVALLRPYAGVLYLIAQAEAVATAGKFSQVQVVNPAASGKLIYGAFAQMVMTTTGLWSLRQNGGVAISATAGSLTNPDQRAVAVALNAGIKAQVFTDVTSAAQFGSAVAPTGQLDTRVTAGLGALNTSVPHFILEPGQDVILVPAVVNVGARVMVQLLEGPNTQAGASALETAMAAATKLRLP